jgi:hypothetical protein
MESKDEPVVCRVRQDRMGEQGVALLTVMIIMLLMVVLAISAITMTGLESRMSGFVSTKEAMSTAAESCEGTAVNIIQQTLYYSEIKPEFLSDWTSPGPIPVSNKATLYSEITGQPLPSPPAAANTIGENYGDNAASVPNLTLSISGVTVNGDIDRLFKRRKEGMGEIKEIVYRITCIAGNTAGQMSTVTSVYSCTVGETCMKQIGGA